jgi:hypothetical protein
LPMLALVRIRKDGAADDQDVKEFVCAGSSSSTDGT